MASAFWRLEDGRGFSGRWSWVAYLLKLITDELKAMEGAEAFYEYLERFVYNEEVGDKYNGYGGFIRGDENIMFNLDLRTFAPQNRDFFWEAAQRALTKLKAHQNNDDERIISFLTTLLDMHKRIKRREDPMELNNSSIIEPDSNEKLGPGW